MSDATMLECVAKAMCVADGVDPYDFVGGYGQYPALVMWKTRENAARAAIEAMRKPTPNMVDAAWTEALAEDASGVWRAMIDAILSEGKGHDS